VEKWNTIAILDEKGWDISGDVMHRVGNMNYHFVLLLGRPFTAVPQHPLWIGGLGIRVRATPFSGLELGRKAA
jgi:hypothetical protein